jgi:hypothetical protein
MDNYLIDRQSLGYELYASAAAQTYPAGGSITWHFLHSLDSIDFAAKSVNKDFQSSCNAPFST